MTTVSTAPSPEKGSPAQREVWKAWLKREGHMDSQGRVVSSAIAKRRRIGGRFTAAAADNGIQQELRLINSQIIKQFDKKGTAPEQWPMTIRVMMNRETETSNPGPFETWGGPSGLEMRKQTTQVWTDMLTFLVLEYHTNNISWSADGDTLTIGGEEGGSASGNFIAMGLEFEEDLEEDLLDISAHAGLYRFYGDVLSDDISSFFLRIIMHEDGTPNSKNNPLLFWVALLLQTEEFGKQPRLNFADLQDSLIMREKLE